MDNKDGDVEEPKIKTPEQNDSTTKKNNIENDDSQHIWTDEDDESEVEVDHVELIKTDPDYLYRLIRLKQDVDFFKAIEDYQSKMNQLPFDEISRVDLFDVHKFSNNDKVPTLSLVETISTSQSINSPTLHKFIGKYFTKMNERLLLFLLTNIPLLRIFVTNFPSVFDAFIFNKPSTTPTEIQLCTCVQEMDDYGSFLVVSNTICFCDQQHQLIYSHPDYIYSILQSSLVKFGCYPCDVNGQFPISIQLKQLESTQLHQVTITFSHQQSFQEFLLQSSRFSSIPIFTAIIKKNSIINQALELYSDWDTDAQFNAYLSYIKIVTKSISLHSTPQSFSQLLYSLQTTLNNWDTFFAYFIQRNHNNITTVSPTTSIKVTPVQQQVYDSFEILLFSFISNSIPTYLPHIKCIEISFSVYNLLSHLLQQYKPTSTPTSLLKHIFGFYIPYLCPYHISIIQHVLPLHFLQMLHPSIFTHFHSNVQMFQLFSKESKSTNALTMVQYNQVQTLKSQRLNQPTDFPLSLLPIHPFSLLSAYLSPYQYNPDILPQPQSTQNFTPKTRTFTPIPMFVQQLLPSLTTRMKFSIFIDPHIAYIKLPDDHYVNTTLQDLSIYFNPHVNLETVKQLLAAHASDKSDRFFNDLVLEFDIRSLNNTYWKLYAKDLKIPICGSVGPHNASYFQLFLNTDNIHLLKVARSIIPLLGSVPQFPRVSVFELCLFGLVDDSHWVGFYSSFNKIAIEYEKDKKAKWDTTHPLYTELKSHFNGVDVKPFWEAHISYLKQKK